MEVTKQKFVVNHPSEDAVRLANDIYYTYLQQGSPFLHISLQRLCKIFGDCDEKRVKRRITELFEELNEPIAVENVWNRGKKIEWSAINFFSYSFNFENDHAYVDIEINEIFLEVLEEFELEPYINFQ